MQNEIEKKMNQYLGSLTVMYMKMHNFHWFIQGAGFFELHLKFEEWYKHTADFIDDVAELMIMHNLLPIASLKECLNHSVINEREDKSPLSDNQTIELILEDYLTMKDLAHHIVLDLKNKDFFEDVEAIFGHYLNYYEKAIWMCKAFLAK